jgi:hypothetical protein
MVLTPTGYVPIEANVGGGSGSPDAPLQNAKPALRSEKLALQKASPDDAKHPGWPAGTPDGKGGQFRPKDSGDSSDDNANSAEPNRPVQYAALDTGTRTDGVGERSSSESVTSESNGPSEPTGQQAEQYAQNAPRGGIGGRPTYFYGDLGEPTPAQEARLAVVEARWNDVFAQGRARDPSWKPSPVAYATIEGEISAFEAGIGEAEQRLSDFASVGLAPGEFAGESIPARGPETDFTKEERSETNRIGSETGCHTCGTNDPGTVSGSYVPDHQPPSALNSTGLSQRLYPQCLSCSLLQGGWVRYLKRTR